MQLNMSSKQKILKYHQQDISSAIDNLVWD